jgi:3-dehydroquinate dehydratase-2
MKPILLLHGPNLNLLGTREPEVYGKLTLDDINARILEVGREHGVEVRAFQSNSEGALIDALQSARTWASGVVFNPGGYTHTSVALRDAVSAIGIPVIEVHLSNVYAREEFRHTSLLSPVCKGKITGFGWRSYWLGIASPCEMVRRYGFYLNLRKGMHSTSTYQTGGVDLPTCAPGKGFASPPHLPRHIETIPLRLQKFGVLSSFWQKS